MKAITKTDKIDYVKSKGWTTLWNEDNWVHYGLMSGANIDRCGISLDMAYEAALKQK